MEASKCPKCGEEPLFIEHLSKWYCYGCNSYVDEEKHECCAEHVHESALPIEEGVKALEHEETARECKTCGAKIQDLKDGRSYCFMCETYQDEPAAEAPVVAEANAEPESEPVAEKELRKLPDEAPVTEKFVGEPEAAAEAASPTPHAMETKIDVTMPVIINVEEADSKATSQPEPQNFVAPKPSEIKIRMCTSCGQPLKYIDKYSRYYCYACRKYAPRDDPARAIVQPPASQAKACPDCGKPMKFIEKYTEWYCYECKKYPLRERAKAAHSKSVPEVPKCQTCGDPLKYVPKYSRHYCYKCKKYAPKDSVQKPVVTTEAKQEVKDCPACHEPMKYVTEYNEWYCYKCRKYSLRPVKPILL